MELTSNTSRKADFSDHLLRHLEYDSSLPLLDLRESLVLGPALTRTTQNRAAWIFGSKEIGSWLSGIQSRILLINGNERRHEKHSAVSFFSAMMLQVLLTEERGNVALFWFFGENANKPIEMAMRSILSQLIDQSHQDVSPLELDQVGDLESFDDILATFVELLEEQLKLTCIFLILDSISFLESGRYREEIHSFIDALVRIVREDEGKFCNLKVFITSPTRCRYRPNRRLSDCLFSTLEVPEVVNRDVHSLNQLDFTEHIKSVARIGGQ